MRALFVIHDQNTIYGASRSLGCLTRELDMDIDLILPLNFKRKISDARIKEHYGKRVKKVWFLPQPAQLTCVHATYKSIHHIKSFVKMVLYQLVKPFYHQIMKHGDYQFIHLNSLILYPMLASKYPMFLHVRELINPDYSKTDSCLQEQLNKAHGVLFISQETKDSCPDFIAPEIVLKNPFDQTAVQLVDEHKARERFSIAEGQTVFAIIGVVDPNKGVDRVIRAFRQADPKSSVLLVVGKDSNKHGYEDMMRREAQGDERIHFVGELENTDELYRITDFVIRGDIAPGAGRTVFESLYAGGGCILPGTREQNLSALDVDSAMEERVYFYPPADQDALAECINQLDGQKMTDRQYVGNTNIYSKRFLEFVLKNS
ncbi:MAG: glycosyltransferase [Clostridia bacterium]|nr:glycosyltransferase [Clostridia bacterium]